MSFSVDAHNSHVFSVGLWYFLPAQRHHSSWKRARVKAPDSAFRPGFVGLNCNALSWIDSGQGSSPCTYYWTFMRMMEWFDGLMV